MKFTSKLTKKDKLMLYFLIVFLVVFGFLWLVIFPQMEKSSELTTQADELEAQKFPIEAAVLAADRMKDSMSTISEEYEVAMEDFYPYMENYEIDKMLTDIMIDKYGLTVESLNMADTPVGQMVQTYQGAVEEESSAADDSTAETEESALETENQDSATQEIADGTDASDYIPVLTESVTITALGDRSSLQSLVDSLFVDYPSLRVNSYTITEDEKTELELSLDIYMKTK